MLSELKTAKKVVGVKQLKKALLNGSAIHVFLAHDADPQLTDPIRLLCSEASVPFTDDVSMEALGAACGIQVRAAAAALVK